MEVARVPRLDVVAEEQSVRLHPEGVDRVSNCMLGTLPYSALHPTRLETWTKESNMYASGWATNPLRHK